MNARRRQLLAAALAGAGVMSATAEADAAAASDDNARILGDIHDELRGIRSAYFDLPREVQCIRDAQNTFLRATGKYPESIEVGTQHWDVVYVGSAGFRSPPRRRYWRTAAIPYGSDSRRWCCVRRFRQTFWGTRRTASDATGGDEGAAPPGLKFRLHIRAPAEI
jgi:hypothetical protein